MGALAALAALQFDLGIKLAYSECSFFVALMRKMRTRTKILEDLKNTKRIGERREVLVT